MKRINDPFPRTPGRFHLRVEATLGRLEESDMNRQHIIHRAALLAAIIIAALLMITAVAAVVGNSRLKQALDANGVDEVSALVQEAHAGTGDAEGFQFAIDEIIWEDGDLYMTCSIAVPEDGKYLVAMYNPTLNGVKLTYNATGWTLPKFCDQDESRVLVYGGGHPTRSTELLTFAVDPVLRARRDNRLQFRAALYRTDEDYTTTRDFGGVLDPPDYISLEPFDNHAGRIAEREIDMTLDASRLPQTVFNDVRERDFFIDGARYHIDAFRMTHMGVSIEYTVSGEGLKNAVEASAHMAFGTPDGKPLGLELGTSGGGSREVLADGSDAWHFGLEVSALIPLNGIEQIILAPVEYPEDADGHQLPPVYDLNRALLLTPVYSEALETIAKPSPTPAPLEDEPIC